MTFLWKRSRQVDTLRTASFTQSTRDCWPAPTPTIIPSLEYPTEFDCVYLIAMDAKIRSSLACSGRSVLFVTTFCRCDALKRASLRFCTKPTPPHIRYSWAG